VIELDAIEFVLKGMHNILACLHLLIVAARILHDLVNHELRVPPDVEAFDACLDGDSEAAEEGLILCHVVGHGGM
jgi:Na+-transporting methylmalonyl-CoA/oxaloacetate decarboxylase gamma subunit